MDAQDTERTGPALRDSRDAEATARARPTPKPVGRIIVLGAVALSAVIVLLLGLALWQQYRSTLKTAVSSLSKLDLVLGEHSERTFESIDQLLLLADRELRDQGLKSPADLDAKNDLATYTMLRQIMVGVPLDGVLILGADGHIVATTVKFPTPPYNAADREAFVALRDNPGIDHYVSAPGISRITGERTIFLGRRIATSDGQFAGAVIAVMTTKDFEDFFRDVLPGRGGAISLWRTDGVLLAHAPAGNADIGQPHALDEAFRNLVKTGGAVNFWTTSAFAPHRVAVAERTLQGFPLVLAVVSSETAILAPWRAEAAILCAGALALLLCVGSTAWFIYRRVESLAIAGEARAAAAYESSQRHKLEEALRELKYSEARFRDIAEMASDWIWESDAQHRFTSIFGNQTGDIDVWGISSTNALGLTRWEVARADPATDESWRAHKADLDAHRPFRDFRCTVATSADKRIEIRVSGMPVFDESGAFVGYHGTAANETPIVEAMKRAAEANALLRDAVETISEGFAIFDTDDRLVMFNDAFRALYPRTASIEPGIRFEEMLRNGTAKGNIPNARGHDDAWIEERIRRHRACEGSIEQPMSDGRWALVTERRMNNGWTASLRIDITAQKRVEQSLRESEARLERAQRVAHTGSSERRIDTDRLEWSDETYRIFGVERGTFIPTPKAMFDLVHPDDRAIATAGFELTAHAHQPSSARYRIVRADGTERTIYGEAKIVQDETGHASRIVAVLKDVTEAAEAAKRQSELEAELRHAEKLKALGTLAGGIAHDLNNTLVPIEALSRLVAQQLPPDMPVQADLATVVQASRRARDLVRQILAFSRKQASAKRPTDLADVAREALAMLRASVPRSIRLADDLRPVPPVLGDAGQLQQIVVNLVTNASQAVGAAAGTVTVALDCEPGSEAKSVRLTVADNGRGMDEATRARVFEPFFTTKPVGEGTGLGLSVVHGIVAGHGGTISVSSSRGEGTVFTVVFPAASEEHGAGETAGAAA